MSRLFNWDLYSIVVEKGTPVVFAGYEIGAFINGRYFSYGRKALLSGNAERTLTLGKKLQDSRWYMICERYQ